MRNEKGFTLIELMITVGIVGILSAIAIPSYENYVAKAQASEGLLLAEGFKPPVAEFFTAHGVLPSSNQDIGANGASGNFISDVAVRTDGAVVLCLNPSAWCVASKFWRSAACGR